MTRHASIGPFRVLAAALALAVLPLCAQAERYQGLVTHVTDGDTVWVQPARGGAPDKIRIVGIDAPEICQAYGPEAKQALASRVLQRRVLVTTSARDGYGRTVARLSLGREDVGAWMVSTGYAWSNHFRRHLGPYRQQEAAARSARLGLWRDARPEVPRDFRMRHGSCH